jgi:molecular chaperone GrpE
VSDQHNATERDDIEQPEGAGGKAAAVEGEVLEFGPTAEGELRGRIEALEAELAQAKDNWMRTAAEFQNYKKRVERDRQELIKNASAGLLLKLLPVLDDFDRAVANIPADIAASPWWGGAQLIQQKLRSILDSEGVTAIEALGEPFDPNLHEAVLYEEAGEGQGGRVIAELQKGYRLRDRVLRPTMVKVGKE